MALKKVLRPEDRRSVYAKRRMKRWEIAKQTDPDAIKLFFENQVRGG